MQTAPHSIKNATIVTLKAISLLYAGNLSQIGNLITLADLVLEAGQEDQVPEHPLDGAIDLRAEEDSPTEAPALAGNSSNSRSPLQDHHNRRSPRRSRCSPTPFRYKVSHLTSSPNLSQVDEGQLYTDRAPNGYRSFHTTLQLITKQGCKSLPGQG